ncbi:midasin-like [Drosophila pseudoobscura]|uniref:Midasin-like n=1 Tax=Drosophila pseudoobscura pseudoobscura TaxID=46245 RepID=A0A6I8W857_DROPS|nr:midasin [Drosophila pseudoobscura]
MHGYWLLLEDLDAATQDTYTILSSLLERQCLNVSGFRDSVKIGPGFQLLVTVRTNKSVSNSGQISLYSLLDKYLNTINVLPLSRNELCKVTICVSGNRTTRRTTRRSTWCCPLSRSHSHPVPTRAAWSRFGI